MILFPQGVSKSKLDRPITKPIRTDVHWLVTYSEEYSISIDEQV
jgi:hypothetical protein